MSIFRRMWTWLVTWFRPGEQGTPLSPKINPENTLLAADIIPPPVAAPEPVAPAPPRYPSRRGKFVKPQGPEREKTKREPSDKPKTPRKPRVKMPEQAPSEDPEQWGQWYFRDVILDQLSVYFHYLKRMRKADRNAYDLHRQLGIHIMPGSAIQNFDNWRNAGEIDELSAWWKETRPSFGAVAYNIDQKHDHLRTIDAPPEYFKEHGWNKEDLKRIRKNAISTVSRGANDITVARNVKEHDALLWFPKFLYFFKFKKYAKGFELVKNADIYAMTVYWDRVSGLSRGWHKRHPGGIPQEYALCIDRETNAIRVLRHEVVTSMRVKSRHADKGYVNIPQKFWTSCADSQLAWAFGRLEASPESYLIRCFIEAALMYESAAMGSMIRVEASKGDLTAAFGVDVKRMAYFFKDRDRVLTAKGKTARIFHIRRPHVRKTKHGEIGVKLSFPGLKQFTWAGYKINITVPGLHHLNLAEIPIGAEIDDGTKKKGMIGTKKWGRELRTWIDEGKGAWQAKEI